MIDYSKMSDDEINDLVIDRLVTSGDLTYDHDDCSGKLYVSGGWCWGAGVKTNLFKHGKPFITHHNGRKLDFCNNPADAWPIILKNRISLMFDKSTEEGDNAHWCLASSPCDQYIVDYVSESKLLRAAMIVFLMMQEENNGG